MANGPAHRLGAGLSLFWVKFLEEQRSGKSTLEPFLWCAGGAALGTLPDILEPALGNPHHRQFFHSVLFGAFVVWLVKKVWEWEPESDGEKALKATVILLGVPYLTHLVMDALSGKRGLPWVGLGK